MQKNFYVECDAIHFASIFTPRPAFNGENNRPRYGLTAAISDTEAGRLVEIEPDFAKLIRNHDQLGLTINFSAANRPAIFGPEIDGTILHGLEFRGLSVDALMNGMGATILGQTYHVTHPQAGNRLLIGAMAINLNAPITVPEWSDIVAQFDAYSGDIAFDDEEGAV